jgi:hypothetical protein
VRKIEQEIFNCYKIPKELLNSKPSSYDSAKRKNEALKKKIKNLIEYCDESL